MLVPTTSAAVDAVAWDRTTGAVCGRTTSHHHIRSQQIRVIRIHRMRWRQSSKAGWQRYRSMFHRHRRACRADAVYPIPTVDRLSAAGQKRLWLTTIVKRRLYPLSKVLLKATRAESRQSDAGVTPAARV